MRNLLIVLVMLLSGFIYSQYQQEPLEPLKLIVGDSLPSLQVEDLFTRPVTIDPEKNRLMVINIWATWCAPCRKELPSLQRLQQLIGEDSLQLIGLSIDADEHVVREYLIERKILFTNYIDKDMSEVDEKLGVRLYPTTYFVSPNGDILEIIEGERVWDSADMIDYVRTLLSNSS